MSTVYVVQEVPNRDLGPATTFGRLELLLPPGDIVLSPGPTVRRLQDKLESFGDNDYLLLMGDPVAIGLATAVASNINRGKVQFLKWSRRTGTYYPVTASLFPQAQKEMR